MHSPIARIFPRTQISSTRADFFPPISSLQLKRIYSSYTAELHRHSSCLPFILTTNHEFLMESARVELMLSYVRYTLELEKLLLQSLYQTLAASITSFCPHQHPSFLVYNFTLLAGIAFLDHVRFVSIISARLELMRSVPSLHRRHTEALGGSARLDLIQASHIIHSYRCVYFLLVNYIHFLPLVPHFLHLLHFFFIVLQVDSI